jgi:hypothetical protein
VHDIEKDMTAAGAADYTIFADLEEEFGIAQAACPASLAAHGG